MKMNALVERVQTTAHSFAETLVSNSLQTATPTPVILKAGNFKIQGDFTVSTVSGSLSLGMGLLLYVLYLPEVVEGVITDYMEVISNHPEWIMCWKALDLNLYASSSVAAAGGAFSFSSRLKRNLNSGDQIALVCCVTNAGATPDFNLRLTYGAQFWTCAN